MGADGANTVQLYRKTNTIHFCPVHYIHSMIVLQQPYMTELITGKSNTYKHATSSHKLPTMHLHMYTCKQHKLTVRCDNWTTPTANVADL